MKTTRSTHISPPPLKTESIFHLLCEELPDPWSEFVTALEYKVLANPHQEIRDCVSTVFFFESRASGRYATEFRDLELRRAALPNYLGMNPEFPRAELQRAWSRYRYGEVKLGNRQLVSEVISFALLLERNGGKPPPPPPPKPPRRIPLWGSARSSARR